MNKLLDLLADIEGYVEMAVDDRKDRENIMDWIHQAMDIAVKNKAHKWPEEKPKLTDWYLVECVSSGKWKEVVYWKDGCFFIDQRCLRKAFNEAITHWWELPEVTE